MQRRKRNALLREKSLSLHNAWVFGAKTPATYLQQYGGKEINQRMLGLRHKQTDRSWTQLTFSARNIVRRNTLARIETRCTKLSVGRNVHRQKLQVCLHMSKKSNYTDSDISQLKSNIKAVSLFRKFLCKIRRVRYAESLVHQHLLSMVYLEYLLII